MTRPEDIMAVHKEVVALVVREHGLEVSRFAKRVAEEQFRLDRDSPLPNWRAVGAHDLDECEDDDECGLCFLRMHYDQRRSYGLVPDAFKITPNEFGCLDVECYEVTNTNGMASKRARYLAAWFYEDCEDNRFDVYEVHTTSPDRRHHVLGDRTPGMFRVWMAALRDGHA